MTNDSLPPCPFCGGQAVIDDPEAYKRGVGYRIECMSCYVSMCAFAGEEPEQLRERWGRRVDIPAAIVEAERLDWIRIRAEQPGGDDLVCTGAIVALNMVKRLSGIK